MPAAASGWDLAFEDRVTRDNPSGSIHRQVERSASYRELKWQSEE
jgi:hypothetical protein